MCFLEEISLKSFFQPLWQKRPPYSLISRINANTKEENKTRTRFKTHTETKPAIQPILHPLLKTSKFPKQIFCKKPTETRTTLTKDYTLELPTQHRDLFFWERTGLGSAHGERRQKIRYYLRPKQQANCRLEDYNSDESVEWFWSGRLRDWISRWKWADPSRNFTF